MVLAPSLPRRSFVWAVRLFLIFWTFLVLGCRPEPTKPKSLPVLLTTVENRRYHLSICLYGSNLPASGAREPLLSVESLTLKDTVTQEEVAYHLPLGDAGGNTQFFRQAAFSPGEETLVLPLGLFQGFGFIHAQSALADLKAGRFFETLTIQPGDGTRYWHEFKGWDGNVAIRFNAGPVHDQLPYRFDLRSKQVSLVQPGSSGSFVAVTSTGPIPVKP